MVITVTRNDAAYLLSADGNFTSAVSYVRSLGKKGFAASPNRSAELAKVVNTFIPMSRSWFNINGKAKR